MDKTRHQHGSIEEKEFKLLVRKDPVTGGLSVATSSTGAWASSLSLNISAEGAPCCTAVISPGPDMLEAAAEALQPDNERDIIETEADEDAVIEHAAREEPATASEAAADESESGKGEPSDQSSQDSKPEEKLEGRPFEEIAKGAAKKASDAKSSGSKQPGKPLSGSRQPSRTITGSSQTSSRR